MNTELLKRLLKRLEWSARYSYCTGWHCCPICRGIKPGHGLDEQGRLPDNQGHRQGCDLAQALADATGVVLGGGAP